MADSLGYAVIFVCVGDVISLCLKLIGCISQEVYKRQHVVRCFEDTNIIHVDGSVDPARDIETINLELIFSDVEMCIRDRLSSMRQR